MPFQFSLEVVLHLRQSVEHQQELRLRAANQQVAKVRHLIEQIDTCLRQTRAYQSQQLSAGTTSAELRFDCSSESMLLERRHSLQRDLRHAQSLRDEQQRLFQRARRGREIFENLRDGQRNEYRREAARREQRQFDEFFLLHSEFMRAK